MLDWLRDKTTRAERTALRIVTEMEKLPRSEQLSFVKREVGELPDELRRIVEPLVLASSRAAVGPSTSTWAERIASALVVIGGVGLFIVLLATGTFSAPNGSLPTAWERGLCGVSLILLVVLWLTSIVNPVDSSSRSSLTRLLAGVGGAGVAATLPGFLEIDFDVTGQAIRGGGALGLFGLVYWKWGPGTPTEAGRSSSA